MQTITHADLMRRPDAWMLKLSPPDEECFDFAEEMGFLRSLTSRDELQGLADGLGVSLDSVDAIGAAWRGRSRAWAFPMRDGDGSIVGVRLRAMSGDKWAITGSKQGMFYDADMLDAGTERVLYVCEGPTDTAAMLTMGFQTAGRASCNGQADQIRALCKRFGFRKLVAVADNDPAHEKRDGAIFYPGRDGALKMLKECGMPFKALIPPAKDVRAWLRDGATVDAVRCLERQMIWRK